MKKVLLLDDNPGQLAIRAMVLRKAEVECVAAMAPHNALDMLRRPPSSDEVGAVVTDHLMPGMDGAEFVRQLRAFNRDIPVIVISGLPNADQEYEGLNVCFRLKPCEPEDFIALVKDVLSRPKLKASA